MKYIVSYDKPNTHLIDIHYIIEENTLETLRVQLPAWRPGRYELGNFAKNIQQWKAFDKDGKSLQSRKITKDSWEISTEGSSEIHIRYNYYAYQLDAGACWLDDKQLYINGVHCFLYVPERMHETCYLDLQIPSDYKVATGLEKIDDHVFSADSFDTLVDCPLIASNSLQERSFKVEETVFHIWMQGECKPDWERIINDFRAYTIEQLNMMGDFPFSEYHYLVQVLPVKFYHGVEHYNSTVIGIGPGYNLMKKEVYEDFTGVCSHELFHAWNIKNIRPVEMHPYDYTRENYSRLGYVAEGVTTYYGDLFLVRSGVYSMEQFFKEIDARLQKHFESNARFSMPVASASFDTWLDGYVPGIPNRKTSIYDEGCLCAMMIDLSIRRMTNSEKSLDDVMRLLYNDFGKKNRGYSESDYRLAVANIAGAPLDDIFDNYIYGTSDYEPRLRETLSYAGCELKKSPSKVSTEHFYGFKFNAEGPATKISAVFPGSPAELSGLSKDDEILTINGFRVENNLNEWCSHFGETITLGITSQKRFKTIALEKGSETYYPQYSIEKGKDITPEQTYLLEKWLKHITGPGTI